MTETSESFTPSPLHPFTPSEHPVVGGQWSVVGELRDFLKQRLPAYMVPAAFVVLGALPLSPNGKVDRRALPPPDAAHAPAGAAFVAPRNPVEARLAGVWSEVLGVAEVGIHDNFFDLGGDSFKAIKLLQKLDGRVALVDLFLNPTIHELAERISAGAEPERRMLYELTGSAAQKSVSLVCVPYGGGSAVVYQPLAQALPAHYSLYSVALPGHDFNREDEALSSIDEFAPQCAAEIQARVRGPIVLYGHCAGVALTLALARLLEQAGAPIEAIVLGGALPGSRVSRTFSFLSKLLPRRPIDDRQLLAYLKSLGGFDEIVDPAELGFVLRTFGHDGRAAVEYFEGVYRENIKPLKAPIICIVGDKDPLTRQYHKRYKEWSAFSHVVRLVVVEDGKHYFVKHQAHKVAQIIDNLPSLL